MTALPAVATDPSAVPGPPSERTATTPQLSVVRPDDGPVTQVVESVTDLSDGSVDERAVRVTEMTETAATTENDYGTLFAMVFGDGGFVDQCFPNDVQAFYTHTECHSVHSVIARARKAKTSTKEGKSMETPRISKTVSQWLDRQAHANRVSKNVLMETLLMQTIDPALLPRSAS